MQYPQVLFFRVERILLPKQIIGNAKLRRWKKFTAKAVVGKGSGFAHQPVDHMPVIDTIIIRSAKTRYFLDERRSQVLNQSNLIGKWLSPAVSTIDSLGNSIANYDTLEFKSSAFIRTSFINVYPGFGWEIGTYKIKLDTICFSGEDYSIDSLHNVIDSQQISYNWKCKFSNDSTLEILGGITNGEDFYFYINKVKE